MARIDDAASSKCSLHGPSFLLPKAAAELEPGRGFCACANRRMPRHFKLRAAFAPLKHHSPYAKESSTKLQRLHHGLLAGCLLRCTLNLRFA